MITAKAAAAPLVAKMLLAHRLLDSSSLPRELASPSLARSAARQLSRKREGRRIDSGAVGALPPAYSPIELSDLWFGPADDWTWPVAADAEPASPDELAPLAAWPAWEDEFVMLVAKALAWPPPGPAELGPLGAT